MSFDTLFRLGLVTLFQIICGVINVAKRYSPHQHRVIKKLYS